MRNKIEEKHDFVQNITKVDLDTMFSVFGDENLESKIGKIEILGTIPE